MFLCPDFRLIRVFTLRVQPIRFVLAEWSAGQFSWDWEGQSLSFLEEEISTTQIFRDWDFSQSSDFNIWSSWKWKSSASRRKNPVANKRKDGVILERRVPHGSDWPWVAPQRGADERPVAAWIGALHMCISKSMSARCSIFSWLKRGPYSLNCSTGEMKK
jgi:hypothetical protein